MEINGVGCFSTRALAALAQLGTVFDRDHWLATRSVSPSRSRWSLGWADGKLENFYRQHHGLGLRGSYKGGRSPGDFGGLPPLAWFWLWSQRLTGGVPPCPHGFGLGDSAERRDGEAGGWRQEAGSRWAGGLAAYIKI